MAHRLAQASIEIAAPSERAFDYAIDLENFPDWFPGAIRVEAVNGCQVGSTGKQYVEVVRLPTGREQFVTIQLRQAVRPQRFVTEGDLPWLLPRMEMTFQSSERQTTRVMWAMSSRRSGIGVILLLPLLRIVIGARGRKAMQRLKKRLESSDRSFGATHLEQKEKQP